MTEAYIVAAGRTAGGRRRVRLAGFIDGRCRALPLRARHPKLTIGNHLFP
jgi:hypothetical protein